MPQHFLLRRAIQGLIVLLAAFTATFFLLQLLPGDAILIKFDNPELGLSLEQIAAIRDAYGADIPWWQQYLHALGGYIRGDFGFSSQYGTAVSVILAEALPQTALLALLGFVGAVALAVVIAAAASLTGFTWLRRALESIPAVFVSIPVFWFGILLIQVFSFGLGWIPVIAADPTTALILPVITLAVPISAPIAQTLLRSIDEVRLQPFVTVVRAKGASRGWTLVRAIARNALLPTLTIAGVLFGELVGGAVVTETVFGRNGIGRITAQAVDNQDIPVLQGIVIVAAATFVVISLVIDVLATVIDPRLRLRPRRLVPARTRQAREAVAA